MVVDKFKDLQKPKCSRTHQVNGTLRNAEIHASTNLAVEVHAQIYAKTSKNSHDLRPQVLYWRPKRFEKL